MKKLTKKFKGWLRVKLRNFLDIEELDLQLTQQILAWRKQEAERFQELHTLWDQMDTRIKSQANDWKRFNDRLNENEKIVTSVRNAIHIGFDVHHYSPERGASQTWCVVMVRGPKDKNQDYINSFEIRYQDYHQLKKILKEFEGLNVAVDKPPHFGLL